MKKKILAIGIVAMLITMLVVLTGCGNENNNTSNDSDVSSYNLEEHDDFNNTFTRYEGKKVSASDVKKLIQAIKNHNMSETKKVVYTNETDKKIENSVDDSKTYTVECKYDMEGYVVQVGIYEN